MSRGPLLKDERGQIFAGYIVLIFIIAAMIVTVTKAMQRTKEGSRTRLYQELALATARQGFEDGLSFFRRQSNGVFLDDFAPGTQRWATPWPLPDAAFCPGSNDTDHWSKLSMTANTGYLVGSPFQRQVPKNSGSARAIIRTFPLLTVGNTSTATESMVSPLWGRYVIRRQNTRNWSPGPNTFNAYTDPEAAHDLTHIRTQAPPGSGNYWSVMSRGYVFSNATGVTSPAYFENPAMHEGGDLVSPLKRSYNNKRLLLATARVYGELYRINFNDQGSAVWVSASTSVKLNSEGIVNGSEGYGIACPSGSAINACCSGGSLSGTLGSWLSGTTPPIPQPTLANAFPGLTAAKLKELADQKGLGVNTFPLNNASNLSDLASRTTFYYITTTGEPTPGTLTFKSGANERVMTGVGLVIVDGNLVFEVNNFSTWAGIVYVMGNVTVHSPVSIQGTLIATGTVTIGRTPGSTVPEINKAEVSYNSSAVDNVKSYLQSFRVLKSSILATYN